MAIMHIRAVLLATLLNAIAPARTTVIDELKSEILGRCNAYKNEENMKFFRSSGSCAHCDNVANAFAEGTNKGSRCHSAEDTYSMLMEMIPPLIKPGFSLKTLLYSGPGSSAEALRLGASGETYRNLQKTFPAFIADGIYWSYAPDGELSREKLARTEACPGPVDYRYWTLASAKFAKNATETVVIILSANVSNDVPIYRLKSVLAQYEVPNLKRGQVKQVEIYIQGSNPKIPQPCDEKSVQKLKDDLSNQLAITPSCKLGIPSEPFVRSGGGNDQIYADVTCSSSPLGGALVVPHKTLMIVSVFLVFLQCRCKLFSRGVAFWKKKCKRKTIMSFV